MIEVTIRIEAEDAPALLKEVAKLSPEMLLRNIPDEPQQAEEKTECPGSSDAVAKVMLENAWASRERDMRMTEKAREIMRAIEENNAKFERPVQEEKQPEVASEPVEEPNEPAEEEKPDAPETKTYKKEEVRAMLAKARDAGHNIKAILKPYGANLTAVAESDYAALMADTLAALGIEEEA